MYGNCHYYGKDRHHFDPFLASLFILNKTNYPMIRRRERYILSKKYIKEIYLLKIDFVSMSQWIYFIYLIQKTICYSPSTYNLFSFYNFILKIIFKNPFSNKGLSFVGCYPCCKILDKIINGMWYLVQTHEKRFIFADFLNIITLCVWKSFHHSTSALHIKSFAGNFSLGSIDRRLAFFERLYAWKEL